MATSGSQRGANEPLRTGGVRPSGLAAARASGIRRASRLLSVCNDRVARRLGVASIARKPLLAGRCIEFTPTQRARLDQSRTTRQDRPPQSVVSHGKPGTCPPSRTKYRYVKRLAARGLCLRSGLRSRVSVAVLALRHRQRLGPPSPDSGTPALRALVAVSEKELLALCPAESSGCACARFHATPHPARSRMVTSLAALGLDHLLLQM